MASVAWKEIERVVAGLAGGVRWWNSDDDIDIWVPDSDITFTPNEPWEFVFGDGTAVEVKNRRGITLAQIEHWIEHNKIKAEKRGLRNALVVKRKAGRGHPTPFIVCIELGNKEN